MAEHARLQNHVQAHLQSFQLLGKGAFGKVYEASGPKGEKYALKISSMSGASKKEEGYLLSEVTTLARFTHPHIVKYVCGWEEWDRRGDLHMYLLMEYCEGKDLRSYLTRKGAPREDLQFGSWLAQIASGLHHVHSKNVLHRNLKTSNIMVNTVGRETVLKIGDFGMARILEHPGAMAASMVGTPFFMSPEALRGDRYDNKTDIWSLGCTAFEIATLKTIFQAQTMRSLISGVKKGLENVLKENIKYNPFFKTLIGEMLNTEAEGRPSALEILHRLASEGCTSMHHEDLGSSVSSTSSSTAPLQRSRSYRSSSSPKGLPPVPEQELVNPEDSSPLSNTSVCRNTPDMKSARNRSHSESDIDTALRAFTLHQKQKPSACKNQTHRREDSTDLGSSAEGTSRTGHSAGSGYETDVSSSATSSVYSPRTGHSSGSGYETDISNSVTSSVYSPRTTSDYGTDEDSHARGSDPITRKSMKIIGNIKKFQTKITKTVGEPKFREAYQKLAIEDDSVMASELEETLGAHFDEVGPTMIYLRMLEIRLDSLEQKRTLTGGSLNQTM